MPRYMLPFLQVVVILMLSILLSSCVHAQSYNCKTYNSLQMAGLKGPVKQVKSIEYRGIQINGHWQPDTTNHTPDTLIESYDKDGWFVSTSRTNWTGDDEGLSYMYREYNDFQHYPVSLPTRSNSCPSCINGIAITWTGDHSYLLTHTTDRNENGNFITQEMASTIVQLDDKCRRISSEYRMYERADTALIGIKKTTYKGDTAITYRRMGQRDYTSEATWYSTPLERDSHGNITRLLSRINHHYELTIYTYTYY